MALELDIWRTGGATWTDYSSWLWAEEGQPLIRKTHPINQPQVLEFSLQGGVSGLQAPESGNRVRVLTGAFGTWFTGYLIAKSELVFLGRDSSSNAVYGYKCKAASEEVQAEWKAAAIFPTLPPYTNKNTKTLITNILAALGSTLTVAGDVGIVLPYFRVKPEETFWDVVRRTTDKTNVKCWTKAGTFNHFGFGDVAFGYSPSEADSQFSPYDLDVTPINNPIFNDVIGVGTLEPQTYIREYFVGDDFTAVFPLKLPLYGAVSSKLLEDDFTATSIDANRWTKTDVNSLLSMASGSLKMFAASSSVLSKLTSVRGLEIGGNLELSAGRVRFLGPSNVQVGGLYTSDLGTLADCVAGFQCTVSGGQTLLKPIAGGAVYGSKSYTTVSGKSYQFILTIDCGQFVRRRRPFFSLNNQYGGQDVTADARVSWSILEVDDNNPDAAAVEALSDSTTISGIAQFLWYTLLAGPQNVTDPVNLTLNFCSLRRPIQAELWTKPNMASQWKRDRLGDKADPLARAAIVPGSEGHSLVFIGTKQPVAKELVRLIYRSAGITRARVRKDVSITSEANKAGDSGVRSALLPSIEPAPRDAAEIERALQAFIDDHTTDTYEGKWNFNSKAYTLSAEPYPGRLITVNAPSRYPLFTALVQEVTSDFVIQQPDGTEYWEFEVKFGQLPQRFDEIVEESLPPDEALQGQLDTLVDLNSIEFNNVGTTFADDRPNGDWSGTKTASTFSIDMGAAPDSIYEVRKTDAAWGTASTINQALTPYPSAQTFTVARAGRDVIAFVKNKTVGGLVSRYPTAIRFLWPIVPNIPLVSIDYTSKLSPKIIIDPAMLDDANAWGYEIRAKDNATVLKFVGDIALTDRDLITSIQEIYRISGVANPSVTLNNPNFESGDTGWSKGTGFSIVNDPANAFQGNWAGKFVGTVGTNLENGVRIPAQPGNMIQASCMAKRTAGDATNVVIRIRWMNSSDAEIGLSTGNSAALSSYGLSSVVGTAPVGTSYAVIWATVSGMTVSTTAFFDQFSVAFANKGLGGDAYLITRSLDFWVYAHNLLGEYSSGVHVVATIPTPSVSGLSVDEANGKLVWVGADATKYKVEVATDAGYTNIIINKTTTAQFIDLDDENILRQRYFRVTPSDELGSGTTVTASHSHTPANVVTTSGSAVNNTDNTYSIPAIPTPTTDITPDPSFSPWADELRERARLIYTTSMDRY